MAIIGCALVTLATFCGPADQTESPDRDRIYYTRFGATYCGNMEYTSCGIRLWNCSDELVYVCLRDVAYRDVK